MPGLASLRGLRRVEVPLGSYRPYHRLMEQDRKVKRDQASFLSESQRGTRLPRWERSESESAGGEDKERVIHIAK